MSDTSRRRWRLTLLVHPGEFAVCRLPAGTATPEWPSSPGAFHSITRTGGELSIICDSRAVPEGVQCTRGWRLLQIEGTFPHDASGVLAAVVGPLAEAGVSAFASATFDTDYQLIGSTQLPAAARALEQAGHAVREA